MGGGHDDFLYHRILHYMGGDPVHSILLVIKGEIMRCEVYDMKRVIDGYVVRLGGERLISGEWGSDDCVWDWDINNHFFAFKEEAEKFFDKQSDKFGYDYPLTYPVVEMCKCTMTFVGCNMINYDIGDTIKWYEEGDDGIDGKPCVVYNI